jgi:hypothetical protein
LETTRRERQYREVQSELAHANRVAIMGQLTDRSRNQVAHCDGTHKTPLLHYGF